MLRFPFLQKTACYICGRSFLLYILLFISIAAFLAVESPYTSPFTPYYIADSSVFFCVGNGLLNGLLPYTDLFDHKGPFLYALYAIGQYVVPGKTGLFILQTLNLSLFSFLTFRLLKLWLSSRASVVILGCVLLFMGNYIAEGALTEEWCATLTMVGMYAVAVQIKKCSRISSFPSWIWVVLGVSLGGHLMFRVTNAALTCGLLGALGVLVLVERQWNSFCKAVLLATIGMLGTIAIPCVLLYAVGCLNDFIHSYIDYNFLYAVSDTSDRQPLSKFIDCFFSEHLCYLFVLYGEIIVLFRRKGCRNPFLWCLAIVTIFAHLSLTMGHPGSHYYITIMPLAACTLLLGALILKNKLSFLSVFLLSSLVYTFILAQPMVLQPKRYIAAHLKKNIVAERAFHLRRDFCIAIAETIPPEATVLAYNTWPDVYLYMKKQPANRYFFLQDFLSKTDPSINDSMADYFGSDKIPQYILLPHVAESEQEEIAAVSNPAVAQALRSRYRRTDYMKSSMPGGNALSLYSRL